ncbi:MAG: RNA polymerase sigma factor, partial [Longimicrobiales bacterium]
MKTASKRQAQQESPAIRLSEVSDSELVAAHLEGHPGAFTELYERYHDRLVHFIGRKTGDRDRAEDLVQ